MTPAIWGDFEGRFEGSAEVRRTLEPAGFSDLGQGVGGGAEELGRIKLGTQLVIERDDKDPVVTDGRKIRHYVEVAIAFGQMAQHNWPELGLCLSIHPTLRSAFASSAMLCFDR